MTVVIRIGQIGGIPGVCYRDEKRFPSEVAGRDAGPSEIELLGILDGIVGGQKPVGLRTHPPE